MYVFFEHHKDAEGNTLATDVTCSSYRDRPGVYWKKDEVPMKLLAGLFKTPPLQQRSYNEPLKIWTYLGDAGKHLLEVVQEAFEKMHVAVSFYEIEDLEAQVKVGKFKDDAREFDPKNFFYNRAALNAAPAITAELAQKRLATIFMVDEHQLSDKIAAKKLYRAFALQFHPDRNGGDGSKMSELNMYWSVYNA